MNSRKGLLVTLLVLALLGIADAWYLAESAFQGAALFCDIGGVLDGCNIVAQSPYSKLFGIPLAAYGVAFYLALFAGIVALFHKTHHPLYQAVAALGVIGLVASAVFLYIQFAVIQALCIYCIVSAVIAALICLLAFQLWHQHSPRGPKSRRTEAPPAV
ncbi:MAG TPA: vitamin K epoxide reductase family protein [Candidatus Paceibacterota bacterium]|nr:vitamin K epoxide reductase family protein [Candidatus Paceibacterota bacterium]